MPLTLYSIHNWTQESILRISFTMWGGIGLPHFVNIDRGKAYRQNCLKLKGQYFSYSQYTIGIKTYATLLNLLNTESKYESTLLFNYRCQYYR